MDDLEYLRRRAPQTQEPSQDARLRARVALLAKINATSTPSEAAIQTDSARDQRPAVRRDQSRIRLWSGRRLALAATTVAVAAAVTFIVLQPGHESSAAAGVRAAAINTGNTESLRATLTVEYVDGASNSTAAEMHGPDVRIQTDQLWADGTAHSEAFTIVGDTIWTTTDGETSSQTVGPNDRLVPFAKACETVLAAAVQSAEVADMGSEKIGKTTATHYRIKLDETSRAALAGLTPSELAWFELEYPEKVSVVDVWVGEKVIKRIQVHSEASTSTTDFFDFGADITIVAPVG